MTLNRLCGLVFSMAAWLTPSACPAATNGLAQEVYVWQRAWNPPVRDAVAQHAAAFQGLVVLGAEVTWQHGQPQVVRVTPDYAALKAAGMPAGLALRIGPFAGPFATNDPPAVFLGGLAAALVAETRANGLAVRELQLDFDCASARLEGYRTWVTAIRQRIAPVPLTITALPDWLKQPAFGPLVAATEGYVLQVHSLAAPASADAPFTLCDPAAALRAVERAGEFNVPFRVALPTYGYLLAFDHAGKFVGLSAEGPIRSWPTDAQLREVRTDPLAMAQLVRTWTTNHPAAMRGVIWYRLPVAGDALNLHWPTVAAMMAGRSPREQEQAEARRTEPGLVEISLVNDGELDLTPPVRVAIRWADARLTAGDGVGGFELADDGPNTARLQLSRPGYRLAAGEKQIIGWLRLSEDREVHCEIFKY